MYYKSHLKFDRIILLIFKNETALNWRSIFPHFRHWDIYVCMYYVYNINKLPSVWTNSKSNIIVKDKVT